MVEVEKDYSPEVESTRGRRVDPVAEASRPAGVVGVGSYVLYMGESFFLVR